LIAGVEFQAAPFVKQGGAGFAPPPTNSGATMKYVLLFCGTPDDQVEFDTMTPEQKKQRYAEVGKWFMQNRAKIGASQQLQGPTTATTVRFGTGARPVIKDGPFLEGKEIVGGYCEIDVENLDEALELAKSWPGRGAVEIRPAVSGAE
jgi:hypothetical protein